MKTSVPLHLLMRITPVALLLSASLIPSSAGGTSSSSLPPAQASDSSRQPAPTASTTTSSAQSPSTAGDPSGWCPLSLILEEDDQRQALLKAFRDDVLARHERGRNYTRLYYLHSPEITVIILSHPVIRSRALKLYAQILPIVSDLLTGGKAELQEQLLDDADRLLNEIAHKASPALREVITLAKSDIIKKEIFEELNITITQ